MDARISAKEHLKLQAEDRERQKRVEEKLDKILKILEGDLTKNCEKMSEHIDFIDNVYDSVKNPLGYICNKVSGIMGSSETFTIADKNENEENKTL